MLYCDIFNVTTKEIWTRPKVFTSLCDRKYVSTLLPTLFQLKSFPIRVPGTQSHETNANFAIKPKMIITNILVSIPVIHENKWWVNFLCPFYTFAQRKQWKAFMIQRLFCHSFYWLQAGRDLIVVHKPVQYAIKTNKLHANIKASCQRLDCLYRCKIKFRKAACTVFIIRKNV
jgi:hypothetical protein